MTRMLENNQAGSGNNVPATRAKTGIVLPPTPRIDLKTIDDVRVEMARVYRETKAGKIDTADGAKLVYMLSQVGKMIEISELEARLSMLEAKAATRQWGPRCEASVPG